MSVLAAAGGNYTNAYLAGAKGKEEVFHALTKTQGVANATYKGCPMLQNAILGRDILLQQFLIRNGADLQYLEPDTGKNYLELKWWVDRAQHKGLWREDPLNDSINTEILEALETAGLKLKDLYSAIASNDPVAFKPFMEDPEALRARNVLSSSRMLSHPGEDNDRPLREVQNYPEPRKNMGFNAMELALRLNSWHVFDMLKELEPPFEILPGILVKELVASSYYICLEDSFAYRKWKEVLDRGIRVSSLPFGSIDMLSSMTCDEAMKMIEALCGVKSDWTEGLTLEQSYLFKGDAMPEEGLFFEVYSNGQARLNGMHSPMQVARTQAEITLSAPSMEALVLQLDDSSGTFKVMKDGEIMDQGNFTTGIGE